MQRNHLWSPSGEIERKLLKQPKAPDDVSYVIELTSQFCVHSVSVHGEAVLRLLKPFHSHLPVLPSNRHFPKEIPGAYHQRNLSQ